MTAGEAWWRVVFGNARPVEVEIGSGTGTFLLPAAAAHPEVNFFAIEHAHSRAAGLVAMAAARQLVNVRILCADARCVVSTCIPPDSVQAYHIYFPDPWWKRRHNRRRLITPAFAAALADTLRQDGCVYVATDVPDAFARMQSALIGTGRFVADPTRRSPRRQLTRFERKGLAHGAMIYEASFAKGRGCE